MGTDSLISVGSAYAPTVMSGAADILNGGSDDLLEQLRSMENNRDFTREMLYRNEKVNARLAKWSQNLQYNMWKNQFDYQSPQNQVKRLQEAGINPSSVYGGSGQQQSQAPSNLGTPQVSATPMNMGSYTPLNNAGLANFGNFIRAMAEARKAGVDTEKTKRFMDKEFEALDAEVTGQKLANSLQEINVYVADKTKDNKVKESLQHLNKMAAEVDLVTAQTQEANMHAFHEECEAVLAQAKKDLTDAQYDSLQIDINNLQAFYDARIKELNTQAGANASISQFYSESAITIRELRNGQIRALDLANDSQSFANQLAKNEVDVSNATVRSRISALTTMYAREGLITDELKEKITSLMKSNKWADWREGSQVFKNIASGLGDLIGAFTGHRAQRVSEMDARSKAQLRSAVSERVKNGTTTSTSRTPSGTRTVSTPNKPSSPAPSRAYDNSQESIALDRWHVSQGHMTSAEFFSEHGFFP